MSTRKSELLLPWFLDKLGFTSLEYLETGETIYALLDSAKLRIKNSPVPYTEMYVGHSGGKDSVLIHYLTREFGLPVVHTPKTSGPNAVHPMTRDFLYSLDCPVHYVPAGLHTALPYTTQVDGTRIAEATRNDGRSTCFVREGKEYPREELTEFIYHGLFGLNFLYPIYDWTDLQVWTAILMLDLPFSSEYLI